MKFYRYQQINKLTLRNLSRGENWISDPKGFNDPFEFNIISDYLYDSSGIKHLTVDERIIKDKIKELINGFGVVCYSTNDKNGLLWSHYGDNHKGMLLVFEAPEETKIRKVTYQNTIPEIDLDINADILKEALKICTTKSEIWDYEEEYRQISRIKNTYYPYPGKLNEIIFGCRTNYEDIKIVASIAREFNPEIIISKMCLGSNSFQLAKMTIGDNNEIPELWRKTNTI